MRVRKLNDLPCCGGKNIGKGFYHECQNSEEKENSFKTCRAASRATSEQDNRTLRVISGVVLALFVIMLALSCISYMFTGLTTRTCRRANVTAIFWAVQVM